MFFEVFKFYFAVLLLCHFLGDFYIQTKKMAKSKEDDYRKTLVHSILYTLPFVAAFLISAVYFRNFVSLESLFLILAAASVAHLVVDLIKCNRVRADKRIDKRTDKRTDKNESESPSNPDKTSNDGKRKTNLFIADQTCHILLLAFIALAVSSSKDYAAALSVLSSEQTQLLYLILLAVFLLVPASFLFQILFKKYQPSETSPKMNETDMENNSQKMIETDMENKTNENEEIKENIKGAGEIIGYMERLLMAIFFCLGQYTAVGFIIAAKSIARYDKISKKGAFAEYYLIGTLYSVLVTLLAFALLWYP